MGAGDDLAGGCLPEDFGQTNDWYHAAIDQVSQGIPRPDGGKLIHVTDHDESGVFGECAEQGVHQEHVNHRGLIHDEEVAVQWLVLVAGEPSGGRIDLQEAMYRLRLQSCRLGKPLRRPSRGSAEEALHLFRPEDQEDRVHEGGLADAGTASNDDDTAGQRGLQCLPLARCQSLSSLLLAPGDGLLEVDLRVGNAGSGQPLHLRCDAVLRFPEVRKED